MTKAATAPTLRRSPLFTPYVVVWTTVGVLSLGYLTILGLAPEWLDDLRPASVISDPQSNQGQRAAARLAQDVNALRASVAQMQLDMAQVKTTVASYGERDKGVTEQLATIEQRLSGQQPATAADAAASTPQASAAPVAEAAPQEQPRAKSIVLAELMQDKPTEIAVATPGAPVLPKVINGDQLVAKSVETGSVGAPAKPTVNVAADAISFGPAVVKPAPKPIGVKISSGQSLDGLRLNWGLLTEKHSEALKKLEPRYTSSGDPQNPTFDLVAGPIKSRAEAAKVCKSLAAQNVPCSVGAFGGEAL